MKFIPLVWKNIWRRKIRTTFTLLSVFVAFLLFGILMTVRMAFTFGVDIAGQRIDYARQHYRAEGLEFAVRDIREPLGDLGPFDFIWIRFVLEYYLAQSAEMVRNAARALAPGGTQVAGDQRGDAANQAKAGQDKDAQRLVEEAGKQAAELQDAIVGRRAA